MAMMGMQYVASTTLRALFETWQLDEGQRQANGHQVAPQEAPGRLAERRDQVGPHLKTGVVENSDQDFLGRGNQVVTSEHGVRQ